MALRNAAPRRPVVLISPRCATTASTAGEHPAQEANGIKRPETSWWLVSIVVCLHAPQVLEVPERDQASQEPDPMAGVLCMHCGSGDDDDLLLLCDGAGLHPYTVSCSCISASVFMSLTPVLPHARSGRARTLFPHDVHRACR